MRALDEPIPGSEDLYRAIGVDHVLVDRILPSAIDIQGTSVHRAKYCDARIPILSHRPDLNGIAAIRSEEFPPPLVQDTASYEFFVVDDPSEHEHHAAIRIRSEPNARESRRIKSKAVRMLLCESLAEKMRLHTRP